MGLFGSIFGLNSSKPTEESHWKIPQTISEIEAVLKKSDKPQIIYKHSPRCGTSILTRTNLESGIGSILEKADVYMIDVISKREISRYVAEKTGVRH